MKNPRELASKGNCQLGVLYACELSEAVGQSVEVGPRRPGSNPVSAPHCWVFPFISLIAPWRNCYSSLASWLLPSSLQFILLTVVRRTLLEPQSDPLLKPAQNLHGSTSLSAQGPERALTCPCPLSPPCPLSWLCSKHTRLLPDSLPPQGLCTHFSLWPQHSSQMCAQLALSTAALTPPSPLSCYLLREALPVCLSGVQQPHPPCLLP